MTCRVWFKDDSAVVVTGIENIVQAKAKAQEIALRNQGIRPKDPAERRRWDKATTIKNVENLTQ